MPIVPVRPDAASEPVRAALDALPDLGLLRMAAHADGAFGAWLAYGGALLTGLELDPSLRELAILAVAHAEGSSYERVQHQDIARRVGLTPAEIAAAVDPTGEAAGLAPLQRLVVRAAHELSRGGAVAPVTRDALAGLLGPRRVVELVLVAGHYVAIARFVRSFAIPDDDPANVARARATS